MNTKEQNILPPSPAEGQGGGSAIASHNSWSYGWPSQWYLRPFYFVARCQGRDVEGQYERGVRLFDLRVRFGADGLPYVCHGLMAYGHRFMDDLARLDAVAATEEDVTVSVRVILETSRADEKQEGQFRTLCLDLEESFPHLRFFGGRRKYDWFRVYTFRQADVPLLDKYSSTTSLFPETWRGTFWRYLDDWWPWLHHRLTRRHIPTWQAQAANEGRWLMRDFV